MCRVGLQCWLAALESVVVAQELSGVAAIMHRHAKSSHIPLLDAANVSSHPFPVPVMLRQPHTTPSSPPQQDPSGSSEFKPMDGVEVEWGEAPAAAAAADADAAAAGEAAAPVAADAAAPAEGEQQQQPAEQQQ